jgi:RNA polymerase sigma-70 factor, ECF subfamily
MRAHFLAGYSTLQDQDEDVLVRELLLGNCDAYALVFDRYYRLVLVTVLRILKDLDEAKDQTQSIFLEFYCHVDRFDSGKDTLKNWFLQCAYHRSINRKNYLSARCVDRQWEGHSASTGVWQSGFPASQEIAQLVSECLETLSHRQREVMRSVFFEGLTLKEVAAASQQTVSQVRHHYLRGLKMLRERLGHKRRAQARRTPALVGKVSRANA